MRDLVMCRSVGAANEPVQPVKAYDPFATFYCAFKVIGAKKGTTIQAKWEDPQGFSRTTTATIGQDGDSNLSVSLKPNGAWIMGTYKVALEVNGKVEQEVRFDVGATPK